MKVLKPESTGMMGGQCFYRFHFCYNFIHDPCPNISIQNFNNSVCVCKMNSFFFAFAQFSVGVSSV